MGDGSLAALHIDIGADISGAVSNLNKLSGVIDSSASTLKNFGQSMTFGLTLPIVAGFTAVIAAASNTESAFSQLDAVLASTGGKAGVTAGQAEMLAGSLSNITRYSFEATLGAEDLLLTFTSIGKDVFPQAIKTVQDMSTALGQDLKTSSIQLGKALNDPIKGITALRRVGVEFTAAQETMIKNMVRTGDLMGAQKVILKELATEFGGSAEAAGDTFAGKLDILKNKFVSLLSMIGGPIIGVLSKFADGLIGVLRGIDSLDPQMILLGAGVAAAAAAIGPLATVLGILIGPIGLVITSVAGLKIAFDNNFLGIRDTVDNFIGAIQPALDQIKGIWNDFISTLFPTDTGALADEALKHLSPQQITDLLNAQQENKLPFIDRLIDAVKTAAPQFLDAIKGLINSAVSWLQNDAAPAIVAAIPGVITGLIGLVTGVASWITNTGWPIVRDAIASVFHIDTATIDQTLKSAGDIVGGLFSAIWNQIKGPIGDFTTGLGTAINTLSGLDWSGAAKLLVIIGGALGIFAGFVSAAVLGTISGVGKALPGLADGLKSIINALAAAGNGDIGGALSGVGQGLGDIASGLLQIPTGIAEQVGKLLGIDVDSGLSAWSTVGDNIKTIWDQIVGKISYAVGRITTWVNTAKANISKAFDDAKTAVQGFIDKLGQIARDIAISIGFNVTTTATLQPHQKLGNGDAEGAGGKTTPKKAFGGDVSAGTKYQVGEGNIPELFMIPGDNGRVIPLNELRGLGGGGGGGSQNNNITLNAYGVNDPIALVKMIDTELERRNRQRIGSDRW